MEITKLDRAKGALVGLALGDALGTTMEFQPRPSSDVVTDIVGGGIFKLKPGQWTDDTAMMLCLADSLIEKGESDPWDQMRRYEDWRDNGYNSCTGSCFDIGSTIARALARFERDDMAFAGSSDANSAGNGSLMRIAPVALLTHSQDLQVALEMAREVSTTTHAEQRCIDACQYMTYLLHTLLNEREPLDKAGLLNRYDPLFDNMLPDMHQESVDIILGSYKEKTRNEINSSGYVMDSLEAALWCFWNSDTFEQGAILAANLGGDADTVAAIYGQLAGAFYGYQQLPGKWLYKLAWQDDIQLRAQLLIARQNNAVLQRFINDCRDNISHSFLMSAYDNELMLNGFEWDRWIAEHRGLTQIENIANATMAECLCLITTINRRDRFVEGFRDNLARNGVLNAILDRMTELADLNNDGKRYVFIGDVHGQHQKLAALLEDIGADDKDDDGFYVFIGDLIDNKPDEAINQIKTLERVKSLVDSGQALCLMGNHEFNAIGWFMRDAQTGEPLRHHHGNNAIQHGAFIEEVVEDSSTHQDWVEWFKRLPLFANFGDIRAIHACWDAEAIERLKPYLNSDKSLKSKYWQEAFNEDSELFELLETLLKGPELSLPGDCYFYDKTGHKRSKIRVRWWLEGANNYRQLAQVPSGAEKDIPELAIPADYSFQEQVIPVVVGHYTLTGYPEVLSPKVVCVDYNAAKDDCPLVAYQWISGEQTEFSNDGFSFLEQVNLGELPSKGLATLLASHLDAIKNDFTLSDEQWDIVDELLWREWDPIGVNCIDACRDEYHAYVQETALLALAGDRDILSAWLWSLALELCWSGQDSLELRERSTLTALKILQVIPGN